MSISCQNVHSTVGDFQRTYLYKFYIETVPTAILAKFPEALNFQKEVDLYNTKAVFPDRKTNNKTIKWSGEFFDIPTTDASTRNTTLKFFDDESQKVWDFFSALKDLTGNEDNQASVFGTQSKFNIGIAKVSVDKNTITSYRRLVGVRVYDIDGGNDTLDKSSEDENYVNVGIRWDRNKDDKSLRGKDA